MLETVMVGKASPDGTYPAMEGTSGAAYCVFLRGETQEAALWATHERDPQGELVKVFACRTFRRE
jgi:hypothetical protein